MNFIKKIYLFLTGSFIKIRDKFIVPPYSEKRRIILEYKKKYGLEVLIETGTFLGDTVNEFKKDFHKVVSFELSADLAAKAKERFREDANVTIVEGDSGLLLKEYLKDINQPCLFWLDGHYSSEFFLGETFIATAKGEKNTPIVKELDAVFSHPVKGHVVLIDDARCFNGKDDYPTIAELKSQIGSKGKDLRLTVKRDIIRIVND